MEKDEETRAMLETIEHLEEALKQKQREKEEILEHLEKILDKIEREFA